MRTCGLYRERARWAVAACLVAAGILAGCDSRSLSWSYQPDAPALVQPGRVVALAAEYGDYRGPYRFTADLANSLAGDMMTRGYRVIVLAGPPVGVVLAPPPGQPPTPPPGQLPVPAPASLPSAASAPRPQSQPAPPPIALAPHAAAREVRADLLVELHVAIAEEVHVSEFGGPYMRHRRIVSVTPIVPQASLRISRTQDQTLVATVTVRYETPADDPVEVAADLCRGLDFIRQGAPPQQVVLKGSGGDVTVKVLRPPPGP